MAQSGAPNPPRGELSAWPQGEEFAFLEFVKKYTWKEFGTQLHGSFYTEWKHADEPYYYVYVSRRDTVASPESLSNSGTFYMSCRDETEGKCKAALWESQGYDAFLYKSYATSGARLNSRLLSYPREAICFIIFHELLHNYIAQKNMRIPYDFHEALGDVIGNYLTLKMAETFLNLDLAGVHKEIAINEQIYACMNNYISLIRPIEKNIPQILASCHAEIEQLLLSANHFQKDRFANSGSNGFLLKNSNYCRNYFLLKEVLLKQQSVRKLLEIVAKMPADAKLCAAYLQEYSN